MIRLTLCALLAASGQCADAQSEILVTRQAPERFLSSSRVDPIDPALLIKIKQTTWHAGCPVFPEDLRQITVPFWTFDRQPSTGILIAHQDVAQAVSDVFRDLFHHGFMIERIVPIENYNGNDNLSMAANNTSAFNCRDVTGQPGKFSNHSWGRAIDINPLTNPYIKGAQVLPPEGRQYLDRSRVLPGSIFSESFIVRRFSEAGWNWGGDWSDRKDYQHFEKPVTK